ncbi:MAG: ABC transporter ATP-binding protein [Lachnospiraceae bacterium]|nr:ABC transporter ATP-binding protein [Lachnospiraceae bacterium]
MRKLLPYLKPYRKECILAPLFKMLEAVFELFVPLVVADLIDRGIPSGDSALIWSLAFRLFLLAVIGMGFSITAQYFAARAASGFGTDLRQAVFGHIYDLSFLDLDRQGISTLITRQTVDVNQTQNMLNMTLRLLLRSPFIVGGAWIMAATVDLRLSLVFAVVIPALSLIVALIMKLTLPRFRQNQKKLDRLMLLTRENLSGVRVIRAFGREAQEEAQFQKENAALNRMQKSAGALSALTNPLTYAIVNAGTVAILYFGGLRVQLGDLTQGQTVAIVNYMAQILVELIKLANLIVLLSRGLASASRLSEVLTLTPSQKTCEKPKAFRETDERVCFRNVAASYEAGGELVLKDISFSASSGEVIGIIGATASGKSTLVSLIPRFYDVCGGQVLVNGVDVRECDQRELRSRIGFVFQKASLLKGTVRENLCRASDNLPDARLWEALEAAQAADFIREKEGALDYYISQNGRNLSGGQRQRLSIARALVHRPSILILDDASSALDFATEARLRRSLLSLSYHPTVFLVSQRTSSLITCDRILVMEEGRVIAQGTHGELLLTCPLYRDIHASSMGEKPEAFSGKEGFSHA